MKRKKGVVPYEGPEKMHEERIKKLTEEAEFALKLIRYQDLSGFEIAIVLKDKAYGETYLVRRNHVEEF